MMPMNSTIARAATPNTVAKGGYSRSRLLVREGLQRDRLHAHVGVMMFSR